MILSSIGALNGWTLMMGQVPMAAAQDGLFPPVFGRLSARGVPAVGIVISAALATAWWLVQASGSPGVRAVYNLIVSLSTMAAVIPYAFCALAVGLIAARAAGSGQDAAHRRGRNHRVRLLDVHRLRLRSRRRSCTDWSCCCSEFRCTSGSSAALPRRRPLRTLPIN